MKKHTRKMIAPVIIALIFMLYFAALAFLYLSVPGIGIVFKILLAVIPAAFCAVMIGVTVARIREIRKGEEDDLGKY